MGNRFNNGISIITIVLNGEKFIEGTILSVINQNIKDLEYIIIDGGSTDGTIEIIEKYNDKISILISESDKGIYNAINKGITLANGSLIGIIHCGDYYVPNTLSYVYNEFLRTGADVIYGDITIIEETNSGTIKKRLLADHTYLKTQMSLFHPSSFVKSECYQKYGQYIEEYKIAADYDLFLNFYIKDLTFFYIPLELAIFRSDGLSSRNINLSLKENYIIRLRRLGRLNALRFISNRLLYYVYFNSRKIFIQSIIGKEKYHRLKIRKYKKVY